MWNLKMLFFLLLWLFRCGQSFEIAGPVVNCSAGQIRGVAAIDGNYSMFLGIPYAILDKNNPFGDSKSHPKFQGIYEAYNDSIICPQQNFFTYLVEGTLDCLILSIYVPHTASRQNKLPVMVWLYEGGFRKGYIGRYPKKGQFLVRKDVILVMPNYRLGPYGFMCLDVPEVPGNQGLKDQILAFKWIQKNIEAFGGDPERVTLFGSSAGAISIDFHFMFTDEKLFHRAILQSGNSVSSTVIRLPDKKAPLTIAEELGLFTDNLTEALSFLAKADPKLVVRAGILRDLVFKPCIEQAFDGVKPFINESWINVRKPRVKGREVMIGIAEYEKVNELIFDFERYKTTDIFTENLMFVFNFTSQYLTKMRNLAKQFYLGDKDISEDNLMPLINFFSDFTYVYPLQIAMRQYLEGEAKQIYRYMFSYVGGRNYNQAVCNFTFNGAIHADELGYLLDFEQLTRNITSQDQLTIDRVTTLFANFAKYGNPTPNATSLLPVLWQPVTKNSTNFMRIGSNLTMEDSLFHDRMAFWDFFFMLNEKYRYFYTGID